MTYDRQRSISDIAFLLNTSSPPSPPSPYSSPSPSICSCSLLVALVPLRFLLFVPFYCCFMCCCSIPPAAASSGWRGGGEEAALSLPDQGSMSDTKPLCIACLECQTSTYSTYCVSTLPSSRSRPSTRLHAARISSFGFALTLLSADSSWPAACRETNDGKGRRGAVYAAYQ